MDPELQELLALLGAKTQAEGQKVIKTMTRMLNTLNDTCGTSDPSQVVGVVSAWKSSVDREKTLSAELATIKAEAERTEANGLLDGLVADGRLEPARRETLEKLYADHGLGALKAASGALSKSSVSKDPPSKPLETPRALTADGLTDDEKMLCKKLNKSVDEYLQDKALLGESSGVMELSRKSA